MKKSSLCKDEDLHQYCPKRLKRPSGQTFTCGCECHPTEVTVKRANNDDDAHSTEWADA